MALTGTQNISWAIEPLLPTLGAFQTLSWAIGASSDTLTLVLLNAPPGLTGSLTIAVLTQDGTTYVTFPTTTGIQEIPAATGRYVATVRKPDVGEYFAIWSDGATTVYGTLIVYLSDRWQLDTSSPARW